MPTTPLTQELARRCAAGVQAAAGELTGTDAEGVCAAFAAWRSEARRPWPWLPGLCIDALTDLAVSFPADDEAAVIAGRVLIAVETDVEAVQRSRRLWSAASDATGPLSQVDLSGQLRQRSLLSAVDTFWGQLAAVARELHPVVVRHDRDAADRIVRGGRRQLEDAAERIATLAARVDDDGPAGHDPPAQPAPVDDERDETLIWSVADLDDEQLPADLPSLDEEGGSPPHDQLMDQDLTDELRAAASADQASTPSRPATTRSRKASSDDVEVSRAREHHLAPILFLAAVTLGALIWLLTIGAGVLTAG